MIDGDGGVGTALDCDQIELGRLSGDTTGGPARLSRYSWLFAHNDFRRSGCARLGWSGLMLDVSKWVVLVVYRENKKRRSAAAVYRQRSFSVLLLEVGMNLEIRHCKIESTVQNHHFVLE